VWSLSIREVVTFVEGWWLDFFEPSQWNEVMARLLEANSSGPQQQSLFDAEGKAVPIQQSLLDEMNALMLESQAQASDEQSRASG